jgi:hypothetical protein
LALMLPPQKERWLAELQPQLLRIKSRFHMNSFHPAHCHFACWWSVTAFQWLHACDGSWWHAPEALDFDQPSDTPQPLTSRISEWVHHRIDCCCNPPCASMVSRVGGSSHCALQGWQDLHDDNKTCMQLSYWELILENGQ